MSAVLDKIRSNSQHKVLPMSSRRRMRLLIEGYTSSDVNAYCECGCGSKVNGRFVRGHNRKVAA